MLKTKEGEYNDDDGYQCILMLGSEEEAQEYYDNRYFVNIVAHLDGANIKCYSTLIHCDSYEEFEKMVMTSIEVTKS